MKTKSYTVYSFAELSPASRQCALDHRRQFLAEQFDGETSTEDAKECLAFAGFEIKDIHWSGFCSQGDGACFTGSWRAKDVNLAGMRDHAPLDTDLHEIADGMANVAARFPEASFAVVQSGHYMHEHCTEFTTSADYAEGLELPEEAEDELIALAKDAMRWIYRQLEKDYEWTTDEAQVIEYIEANEYEFTEEGKID